MDRPSIPPPHASASAPALREANRRFFDPFWADASLVEPHRFNTWPLVGALARDGQRRLEVGPGLRPRLPLAGTAFVDASAPAVAKLRACGARAVTGWITALPFPGGAFELVAALDVVEHVDDDERALGELARVTAAGARLLLSLPLHPERWTRFDTLVGHRRRYEPAALAGTLARHGFEIEKSAAYGMQPRWPGLVELGLWFLDRRRRHALWWYERLLLPLGLAWQSELDWSEGLIAGSRVDEILLLCRKR